MTVALSPHAPFSLAETFRELFSGLMPTSDAPASIRRANELAYAWDGTGDMTAERLHAKQRTAVTADPTPRFTELSSPVDELAGSVTAIDNPDYDMAALALAADSQDERAFLAASARLDWRQRDAAEFLQAIQWALAAGAHRAAGRLALHGAAQHPDSAKLQNAARVLAPPTSHAQRQPADPSVVANRTWLTTHRSQYRGRWVALRLGELLASADTFEDLTARFGISPEILYTRVV